MSCRKLTLFSTGPGCRCGCCVDCGSCSGGSAGRVGSGSCSVGCVTGREGGGGIGSCSDGCVELELDGCCGAGTFGGRCESGCLGVDSGVCRSSMVMRGCRGVDSGVWNGVSDV